MPFKKNNPGCNASGACGCENDCEIASDNFNRDDADDINDGAPFEWSGDNENIWVVSNALLFFSGVPEKLTCDVSHPDDLSSGIVRCTFTCFADDDEVEVWLNGTDSGNCTVARLIVGSSGSLQLITRISGVDTVVASIPLVTVATNPQRLNLVYSGEQAAAYVGDEPVEAGTVCNHPPCHPIDPVGDFAGIGTGNNAGSIVADDFLFERYDVDGVLCQEVSCTGHPPCYIVEDDFNRSNTTNLASGQECNWTEVSGDWAIASNTLQIAGNGLIIQDAVTSGPFILEVDFRQSESFASACVVFGYQDSSNYLMAQFDVGIGGSRIWLYEISGGTPTLLRQRTLAMLTNTTYTATVCVNESGDVAISVDGVLKVLYYNASLPGNGIGLSAIASTGTATFDSFSVHSSQSEGNEACDPCAEFTPSCGDECKFDDSPDLVFVVDLGSGGLSDDDCSKCDEIAGEFTAGRINSCFWNAHIGDDPGCIPDWNIRVHLGESNGKCYLRVTVDLGVESSGGSGDGPFGYAQYETDISDPSIKQSDGSWILHKSPGHTDPYRGLSGWFNPGEDWTTDGLCGGALPETISVRPDYV